MTLQEFVAKYHGTEHMFKLPWMMTPCNCIVLASVEKGISVKPLFRSQAEENQHIIEKYAAGGVNCEERTKDPTYCLATVGPDASKEVIREAAEEIEQGFVNSYTIYDFCSTARCLHAD